MSLITDKWVVAVVALLALGVGGAIGLSAGRPPEQAKTVAEPKSASLIRAMTAEEEIFAAALWPIHSEVKMAAIRATFAGIKYKTGDDDIERLRSTAGELTTAFERARTSVAALSTPPSLAAEQRRYLTAVDRYREAAALVAAADPASVGDSLQRAQALSLEASEATLIVGDVLWPSEHKPH